MPTNISGKFLDKPTIGAVFTSARPPGIARPHNYRVIKINTKSVHLERCCDATVVYKVYLNDQAVMNTFKKAELPANEETN